MTDHATQMPRDETRPLLSVVTIIASDTLDGRATVAHLDGCLASLAAQVDPPTMEIIVPYHARTEGIDAMRARYAGVRFLLADGLVTWTDGGASHEVHHELRARGLAAARGEILGLTEDMARMRPDWAARMAAAHRAPFAAIGGAIENGIDRPLNWAVYFCDFGSYQNPVRAGASRFASDVNITYKRAALEAVRPVWREIFQMAAVHWALVKSGETLALTPEAVVVEHREGLRLGTALRERVIWGRSYAGARVGFVGAARRGALAALSPALPPLLLARMAADLLRKRRSVAPFLRALPYTIVLLAAWAVGELIGYVTGRATAASAVRRT